MGLLLPSSSPWHSVSDAITVVLLLKATMNPAVIQGDCRNVLELLDWEATVDVDPWFRLAFFVLDRGQPNCRAIREVLEKALVVFILVATWISMMRMTRFLDVCVLLLIPMTARELWWRMGRGVRFYLLRCEADSEDLDWLIRLDPGNCSTRINSSVVWWIR